MQRTARDEPAPRRGRPRKAGADDAILEATRQIVIERGYSALTMDEVARRAGVGRQTVYRRWPSKAALVVEQMTRNDPEDMFHDTGSFEGDLRAGIEMMQRLYGLAPAEAVAEVYFAMASDVDARAIFNRNYIEPRRASLQRAIERGIARGELRADTDVSTVGDLAVGPMMYRRLVRGHDVRDELVDACVDAVMRLFGRRRVGPRRREA